MSYVTKTMACLMALAAGTAQGATLVDFTDASLWSGKGASATTSVMYGGTLVSLSATGGFLNFDSTFDGDAASPQCADNGGALACDNDGLGVNNSEISNTPGKTLQSVTVTFSRLVTLHELAFLDFYTVGPDSPDPSADDAEEAILSVNGGPAMAPFIATEPYKVSGGFGMESMMIKGVTSITLFPGEGNDGVGVADFSLAALQFKPIPTPAALPLLLAALGGMVLIRRK